MVTPYDYGCENKRYTITFYRNMTEQEDKHGSIHKVTGIIANFNPMKQTAIKDDNGDLWVIDSRLISVMKPAGKFDRQPPNNDINIKITLGNQKCSISDILAEIEKEMKNTNVGISTFTI